MLNENMTLLEELNEVGEIRHSGCVLCVDGDRYVMFEARNIANFHSIAIECTSEERLIAHWEGFKKNVKAV